jgi:membrane protease YdiL (CAAX protease family)
VSVVGYAWHLPSPPAVTGIVHGSFFALAGLWGLKCPTPAILVNVVVLAVHLLSVLFQMLLGQIGDTGGSTMNGLTTVIFVLANLGAFLIGLQRLSRADKSWGDLRWILGMVLGLPIISVILGIFAGGRLSILLVGSAFFAFLLALFAVRAHPELVLGGSLPKPIFHLIWPPVLAVGLAWLGLQYAEFLVYVCGPTLFKEAQGIAHPSRIEKLVLISAIIPIAEEFLFRGVIQSWLRPLWGPPAAILVTATLFALIHVNPPVVPLLFTLGLTLGMLRTWSGSLLPCILLHGVYNGFAVT